MDTSALFDDEVVADSEEEDNHFDLQLNDNSPAETSFQDPSSTAFADAFTKAASNIFPVPPGSRVDAPSAEIPPSTSTSDPAINQRPRPRPAYKKKDTTNSPYSANPSMAPIPPPQTAASINSLMDIPSTIADRAKMRSRNTKTDKIGPIPSEKHGRNLNVYTDVIELSSDDDELSLLPPVSKSVQKTKPKPRPKKNMKLQALDGSPTHDDWIPHSERAKPRNSKTTSNKRSKIARPASPAAHAPSQDTLPLPSSSLHSDAALPIPFKLLPSQLPPSDPPTSTPTMYDHPPIAVLPNTDTDIDIPSSPSSLFDVVNSSSRKRKRATQRIDELESDDTRMMPPPPLTDPPPTFFAGSSSSPHMLAPEPPADIVGLPKSPPISETSVGGSALNEKGPRSKHPPKKGGEGGGNIEEKPKRKRNSSRKKVEVVIHAELGSGKKRKETENFKSKEFIDDDEDDSVVARAPLPKAAKLTKPSSLTSLSSLPNSDEDMQPGPSNGGRQLVKSRNTNNEIRKDMSDYGDEGQAATVSRKGKAKRLISSDDEDEGAEGSSLKTPLTKEPKKQKPNSIKGKKSSNRPVEVPCQDRVEATVSQKVLSDDDEPAAVKENFRPNSKATQSKSAAPSTPSLFPSISSRYSIAPKTKSTPMSELIRRVNSLPGSPFPTPRNRASASTPGTVYSPYLKASKSLLSRIAPLHPNRRTPPPPLPPPPPPKKTKKEREREEQWEEELIESVGGITEWACMTDAERKDLRKAKWEREMSGWED